MKLKITTNRAFVLTMTLMFGLLTTGLLAQTPVFINEIHYDNSGGDVNEAVEIAGPAGTDLSEYQIILYNGNGGAPYDTENLSGTIPDEGTGYGTACFLISGIQNGDPDGIVLYHYPTTGTPSVVQFLSYEGSFSAVGGVADGMTSTDIGVNEPGGTSVGFSLQLEGVGTAYEDFVWAGPYTATCGSVNASQSFGMPVYCAEILSFSVPGETGPAVIDTVNNTIHVEVYNGTDLTQLVPTFNLCAFSNVIDTSTFSIITSGVDTVDFSDTVVWQVISEVPFQFYEIIITEATTAAPSIVINEIDYDQPGTDYGEFIELMNNGTVPVNLNGMVLQLINGSGGAPYASFNLPDTILQPGEYFVVCGDPANVPECDLQVSPSSNLIQNGYPEAVALLDGSSQILDAVSYEGSVPGYVEVSGDNLFDPDGWPIYANGKSGISRIPDGVDTDNNNADFEGVCITPGMPNYYDTVPCVCTITNVSIDSVGECELPDGLFSTFLTIEYVKDPGTGTLDINGQSFPITGSPQQVELELPADGSVVNLEVEFSANTNCDWFDYEALQAPDPCVNCVDTVYTDAVGECDGQNNTYIVSFVYEPTLVNPGYWVIQAGNFNDTVYWGAQGPGTEIISGLIADGMPVDVTIFPVSNPGCVSVFEDVWTAPENCYTPAALVINEVDYDQPGGDDAEFIELKNNSPYTINLEGYKVELINGSNDFLYDEIYLPAFMLAPGDYFVLCGDPGMTPNCDMDLSQHRNNYNSLFSIQNGSPDAMAIYSPYGDTLDRLSYEGSVEPFVEVSGSDVEDRGWSSYPGHGISRYPDGVDSDNNNDDFAFKCITPGESNSYLSGYCGPFHTGTFSVYYENAAQTTMYGVELVLMRDGDTVAVDTTDVAGEVVLDSLQNGNQQLHINPFSYPWGWGGVNAVDALLIAMDYIGYIDLVSPYAEVADVTDDAAINSTDALHVSKRFAGLQTSFAAGDWNPVVLNMDVDYPVDTNFNYPVGLLNFGDVNGSHVPVGVRKASETKVITQGQLMMEEAMNIPFSVDYAVELGAAAIVLNVPAGMDVKGVSMADGSTPVYSFANGRLTVSWFSLEPMNLSAGELLMTLHVSNAEAIGGSFDLLPGTEFANSIGDKAGVANLIVPEITEAEASVMAFPNPAEDIVSITYSVPESGMLDIEILDMMGARVQMLHSAHQNAGNYSLEADLSKLAEGTYMIHLRGENFSTSSRLVIVK